MEKTKCLRTRIEHSDILKRGNNKLKNLEKAKTWDEVVPASVQKLIGELEEECRGRERCVYLSKEGNFFYYCRGQANELLKQGGYDMTKSPSVRSCQIGAQLGHLDLQLWCLRDKARRETCLHYSHPSA